MAHSPVDVMIESMQDYSDPEASPAPTRWKKTLAVVGGVAGLVGLAGAAGKTSLAQASVGGLQGKEVVDVTPADAACSAPKENCAWTGCCKVTGHKCFGKADGLARCNETCTPGVQGFTSCDVVKPNWEYPAVYTPGTSLYCLAVYTHDTGSTEENTELELLTKQREYDVSIFECDDHDVFADIEVSLGKGTYTIKLEDTFDEFHQLKREDTGSWVNWAMFYQMWVKVKDLGKFHHYDYTVKVDPDAVFLPSRMRSYLSGKKDTANGVYYENCKNVNMGFFGNTEVLTHKAVERLTDGLDDCHKAFGPCANDGCDWKFGAWGEDVFAQRCMDRHEVNKVQAFDLSTDGACEADRPAGEKKNKKWHAEDCSKVTTPAIHPFKKVTEYFKCLGDASGRHYNV